MNTAMRPEAKRHQGLIDAAQSLLALLDSPQNFLYFQCSYDGESMPDFDPSTYFETRGMEADNDTIALLPDLLELYFNVLIHIEDFNLKQKYLSAPQMVMDESLLGASSKIAELERLFAENLESLRRFMVDNGIGGNIIPLHIKEEDEGLKVIIQKNLK